MKLLLSIAVFAAVATFASAATKNLFTLNSQFMKSNENLKYSHTIKGSNLELGEFPWRVNFLFTSNYNSSCGGTIISDEWILTSAKCIFNVTEGLAYVGDIYSIEDSIEILEFHIHPEYIHEEYGGDVLENNIGLVKVASKISFTDNIDKIQLASEDEYLNKEADVIFSGWGLLSMNLCYTNLTTISNEDCQSEYYPDIKLEESALCALREIGQIALCPGEEGGPLISYDSNGIPKLVGITIRPFRYRDNSDTLTLYSRISSYRSWVKSVSGI